ncbi:MAG: hypothetical protein WCD79_05680 [Chthoniobacteraceae bacterium]
MHAPLPRFAFQSIVLAPENLRYNPCDDLIFPSVIKTVGHIAQPLGKYYMYYAPHDAPGGICLAYAGSPEGPWSEYGENPIIAREWPGVYNVSHVSSPHVIWMESTAKFFLYFHGENDTTRIASSVDGIHFDYEGVAVSTAMYDGISEASYARVFPCKLPGRDAAYVILFMGNNGGTRRIYSAWSRDGIHFEAQKKPLISPPPGTGVTQVGSPWFFPCDGRNLVIFHGDKTKPDLSDVESDLYIADVGTDFTEENHLGVFYGRESVAPVPQRVSDACIFADGGRRWLFTAVGPRLKQAIAISREIV